VIFILDLIQNIALLLALSFVHRFITQRWQSGQLAGKLASALLYGLVCIVTMSTAITLSAGIIFDARTVVLSMAGLFGGPFVAVIAGTIAGAWRLYLGGSGALIGIYTILSSVLIGLVFHHYYRNRLANISIPVLVMIGVIVHITTILWFTFLPVNFIDDILLSLASPYLLFLTFATVALGLLLRDIEKIRQFDIILGQSKDRFRLLFNTATVSIWEEDFSEIVQALDNLRSEGVSDLRQYLNNNPDQVSRLAGSIKVSRVNPASIKLFRAKTEKDLTNNIESTFGPSARPIFIEGLCAIWDGAKIFQAETTYRTLDGTMLDCIVSFPVPKPGDLYRHIPVSIVDISGRKQAELHAQRLSRLRQTMLLCNKVIQIEKHEAVLMQKMVDILVENHGYVLVWVGVPMQDQALTVLPVATAGKASHYLDQITLHWSDDKFSQGPTGMAIKTGQIQRVGKIKGDAIFEPWVELAVAEHINSSIALPLFDRGKVFATLNVYSTLENSFDDEETGLLSEFANSLGLAIQSLRTEAEKEKVLRDLNRASLGAINAIAATIEKRDPYTSGHQDRVATLAVAIARKLGWDEHRIEGLRLGATIHDIGKIYVPAEILNRPGKLSEAEFEIIKSHPQVGYEILEKTDFPWPIKEMIVQHHERLNGSGYPKGLEGDQIIGEARIIAVADVVEAITSHRPYRPGFGLDKAIEQIKQGKGILYDSEVVDACVSLFEIDKFVW